MKVCLMVGVLNIGYRQYSDWQNYISDIGYRGIYRDMSLNTECHFGIILVKKYSYYYIHKNILNYLNKFRILNDTYLDQFARAK